MRFALPGSKRELETEGVVCWSNERTGMALRFTRMKPADQTAIDEFVNAHFFRSVKTIQTGVGSEPGVEYRSVPCATRRTGVI